MKSTAKTIQPVDKEVGVRVRSHRRLIGMSQGTLALQIGVTFQQVQKYEKGSNRIGSSRMLQIAAALGVSVSALFGDDESPIVGGHFGSTEIVMAKDALNLNKAFLKIRDVGVRKSIVDLVTALGNAA